MFFIQEQNICQRYDQLMEAWEKKVERMENNPRRKAKESRTREYYERQFPEIRKQREQQERFQRYHALYPSLVRINLLLMRYNTLYVFLCWSLAPHTCSTWYISAFLGHFLGYWYIFSFVLIIFLSNSLLPNRSCRFCILFSVCCTAYHTHQKVLFLEKQEENVKPNIIRSDIMNWKCSVS